MKFKSLFLTLIFSLSLTTATPTKAEIKALVVLSALAGAWYACVMIHHGKQARTKDKPVVKKIFHEATFWTLYIGAICLAHRYSSERSNEQLGAIGGFLLTCIIYEGEEADKRNQKRH